jgi:hypothetical protein
MVTSTRLVTCGLMACTVGPPKFRQGHWPHCLVGIKVEFKSEKEKANKQAS